MRRRQSELVCQREGFRVEVVPVAGATRLVTVGTDANVQLVDAIVRYVPPANETPEQRETMRQQLLRAGARHVWVAPRAAAPDAVNRKPRREAMPAQSPHALIEKMVDEAHTRDRELLRQVVDEALAQAGMG